MHIEQPPPALRDKRPGMNFSPALEAALRRGLAKSPADRFQSPEEFAAALEDTPEAIPVGRATSASTPNVRALAAAPARLATAAGFSHAATMHAPPPGRPDAHAGVPWLAWILGAAVLFGGLYTWNALGRPGLGKPGGLPGLPNFPFKKP
jgi:hypothetical protein